VGAFYYWIIGIGAEPQRFAWNSGLEKYYSLSGPTAVKGSYPVSSFTVNGYYDLLARAFVNGTLVLPVNPHPKLLALRNPWDERANEPYRLLDLAFYQNHYYLYHGATPAVLLFAPWYLLTAHDMPENFATFLFALAGYFFLSRLFIELLPFLSGRISVLLVTFCLLALGIAQSVPFLLHRAIVYEVAIACGFCCLSAGFYFLFRWLNAFRRRSLWSGLSGLSFGLAIGCRPHFGLAAVCAFVFLLLMSDRPPRFLQMFTRKDVFAFGIPMIACCLAIAAYNYARFGNPLEFGQRFQLGVASYQNVRLALENVAPGLYYLLLCPPDLVPEFPFFRLALREPFDAVHVLPARYFLEPTGGILGLCPIAFIAILTPLCFRRFRDRRGILVFISTMLVFAIGCMLFLAAIGLTSQRFEVDFQPFLVFVACVVACEALATLQKWSKMFATIGLAGLLLYSIGANVALAVQGPYDQFVQASPHTYVTLARWFSPFERFRPIENPELRLQASFDFSLPCTPESEPLISTGEFGSRYLLSEECSSDGRLRITSETSVQSTETQTIDVPYSAGLNFVGLLYTPEDRTVTISWNGNVVLRQPLRFLITAPSQIHFGWDPTLDNKATFPRRIVVYQQDLASPQAISSR